MRIITYIYHKHQPNVGKYTIHGWYGFVGSCWKVVALRSKEVLVRLERLESQQLQTATANAERREEIRLEDIIGFVVSVSVLTYWRLLYFRFCLEKETLHFQYESCL